VSYRPLFGTLNANLKREKQWKSVEVHAIYALVYLLCTSKEGVLQLKNYLSAKDERVFHPLFIAQYLLIPVNTIVKNSLQDWMMEPYYTEEVQNTNKKNAAYRKYATRSFKAGLYLKHTLLVSLMTIVRKHGRIPKYFFDKDERLKTIKLGYGGLETAGDDPNKQEIAFNSFLTVWLLTLPEKFEQWYTYQHRTTTSEEVQQTTIFNLSDTPSFPGYKDTDCTALQPSALTKNFNFLPKTWDLMDAFEHFREQKTFWTTPSIEWEYKRHLDEKKMKEPKEAGVTDEKLDNTGDLKQSIEELFPEEDDSDKDDAEVNESKEETQQKNVAATVATAPSPDTSKQETPKIPRKKRSSGNTSSSTTPKTPKRQKSGVNKLYTIGQEIEEMNTVIAHIQQHVDEMDSYGYEDDEDIRRNLKEIRESLETLSDKMKDVEQLLERP
jgi:hypothetical protein